jgi:TPR repeat protein
MMMKKAVGLMENKDMVSARLMLEHLAKNGSARAALVMGKTFDPAYMQANDMSGLKPDIAKARQWYSRAAELGDGEAPSRLNGLASR